MHSLSKRVQCTNLAERYQLRFLQFRETADQTINPLERARRLASNSMSRV